jgi:hypothetical protein
MTTATRRPPPEAGHLGGIIDDRQTPRASEICSWDGFRGGQGREPFETVVCKAEPADSSTPRRGSKLQSALPLTRKTPLAPDKSP